VSRCLTGKPFLFFDLGNLQFDSNEEKAYVITRHEKTIMTQNVCPICGGAKQQGTTTFTVDYTDGVLAVRNVPATICSQCGEEWIADINASRLEQIANAARGERKQFEVVDYAFATAA
jgi:YgiT-type zinc finger domain-containing protein